ncbi:DHHA1 domain-containing protein [Bacillus songklensis]|uniref:DHHA1 domain-containing protein n=1 Tax=Bacillus songklensis TaxID=1069116 RepID=A0ABV8B7P6_9BACI
MSEKLYYTSPKTAKWSTSITNIVEHDNEILVTLQKTAFYPEGGGQPCDTGTIGGIEVLHVFEEDNEVYHQVSKRPEKMEVECEIDWKRRFDHMQHHTGQHLLSAVCIELYDAHTVGFHLGTDTVTIDLAVSSLTSEQLSHIERRVNEYIYDNKEIKTYTITHDQIHTVPLRKLPDVGENIRIVEISGIDYSACCGTHVAHTGEIGLLKLLKTEKQRGNTRLHFKCGVRALADYQETLHILTSIAAKFSTGRQAVMERIDKMEQEQKQLQKEIEQLKIETAAFIAKELIAKRNGQVVAHLFDDQSMKDLQTLAKLIIEQGEYLILFASTVDNKLLLTRNSDSSVHCGQLFKEHLGAFGGKGGGNASQAQAGFNNQEELERFFSFIQQHIG